MKLLIATANLSKVREFREMLGDSRFEWSDLANAADVPQVEETGATFLANACLKATAYAKHYNTHALSDDSGLEVDALDRKPGVFSARWAAMHESGKGDADNNRLLLKQLEGVQDEKRTARFVCALALSNPAGEIILTARDTIDGRVLREPRGSNGFGYDPLFLVESLGKTTAELSSEEKHRISHRGNALMRMKSLIERSRLCEL